ncbi:MAG: CooT family nickel-binding protein [Desulfobacteraceae bacterium]|jgi:predicted RNA-binding protein
MCEANAYLVKKDQEELLMEAVDTVAPEGDDTWRLVNIFGNQKMVKGRIMGMKLVDHKIFFEALAD